jgi:hypothetical protein
MITSFFISLPDLQCGPAVVDHPVIFEDLDISALSEAQQLPPGNRVRIIVIQDNRDLLPEQLVMRMLTGSHQVLKQDFQLLVLIEAPGSLHLFHEDHQGVDEVSPLGGAEDQDLIPGNIHVFLVVAASRRM